MNTHRRADIADDLLLHIARGPGSNPDSWVSTYHRLKRNAPEVDNNGPASTKR